jgi:hypothetical protein
MKYNLHSLLGASWQSKYNKVMFKEKVSRDYTPRLDHMERIWKPIRTLMSPYFSMIFSRFTSLNFSNCRDGCVRNATARLK